ncbi:hypothetical protein [Hymenobacter nivis]|uniref:Uncharacterized protein n=1 Tax=Hymenobacter nivis TaxID=1850093 RepID=A0A2Z3GGX1_9BACT|nr:hypothetical protein [Hymenobacter nivis]AWM33119.1 hypothetical protein DDQ68_10225 [Hymenobacter nivis]
MPNAVAVQLPFWQDPQSPLALAISVTSSSCEVFFTLWDEAGEELPNHLGKITFSECWATSTVSTDLLPYAAEPHAFTSFLLEVPNSAWLAATRELRERHYYGWKHWDKFKYHRHYVVQGGEGYLEVLASSFAAGLASDDECRRYAFLRD